MSLYRNLVWMLKGAREYGKAGFERAQAAFNASDLDEANARGKRVMVTGANSGIGYECALALAERGAIVHMVCRSKERGQASLAEIVEKTKNNQVHLHIADMTNLQQCVKLGRYFDEPLDALILNAGAMLNERKIDEETGLETNFLANTMGTYVTCESLLPALSKASAKPRVIVVASGGMLVQKLNAEDPSLLKQPPASFDGTMVYAQNKRQQVVLVEEWAKAHPNIHFTSMHPGWSDTPGVQTAMPRFYNSMKNSLRTAKQGADTAVWLAIAPKAVEIESGSFCQDRQAVAKHLPMAYTHSTPAEVNAFVAYCAEFLRKAQNDASA